MTIPPKQCKPRVSEFPGQMQRTAWASLPCLIFHRRFGARSKPRTVFSTAGSGGFSLVEVTIALGLVAYALLALLGLFTVGLSSSRESSTETALSQIALHVTSSYSGTLPGQPLDYSYEGLAITGSTSGLQKHFAATVSTVTHTISNTSTNLHLLKISITSTNNPGVTNTIQASAFVP